jgi:hypothetical protein
VSDNVIQIGGGGLLYEDAREAAAAAARARGMDSVTAEDFMPDAPPASEPPEPESIIAPSTVRIKMPEEDKPEKKGPDWRELFSTVLELLGVTALTVGGWLIAPYVGLFIVGVALVLLGVATSRAVSG